MFLFAKCCSRPGHDAGVEAGLADVTPHDAAHGDDLSRQGSTPLLHPQPLPLLQLIVAIANLKIFKWNIKNIWNAVVKISEQFSIPSPQDRAPPGPRSSGGRREPRPRRCPSCCLSWLSWAGPPPRGRARPAGPSPSSRAWRRSSDRPAAWGW